MTNIIWGGGEYLSLRPRQTCPRGDSNTSQHHMILLRNFHFYSLIPTPDFPRFIYMLSANLGELLYGDVSLMNNVTVTGIKPANSR